MSDSTDSVMAVKALCAQGIMFVDVDSDFESRFSRLPVSGSGNKW